MKPEGKMTLSLTRELEQFVNDEVRRGASASSGEYVRNLIRERYLQKQEEESKLASLEAALTRGIADAEAGRVVSLDEAFRTLRATLPLGPPD